MTQIEQVEYLPDLQGRRSGKSIHYFKAEISEAEREDYSTGKMRLKDTVFDIYFWSLHFSDYIRRMEKEVWESDFGQVLYVFLKRKVYWKNCGRCREDSYFCPVSGLFIVDDTKEAFGEQTMLY